MNKGIIAYEAEATAEGVLITRAYADRKDNLLAKSWNELTDFLVEDKGEAFHIVWNLGKFTNTLFTLLPQEKREILVEAPRTYYNNSKIFYVNSRVFGLTNMYHLRANTYRSMENNFYQIRHWLSPDIEAPETIQETAKLGEEILEALAYLGIYPDRLTSPVAVYSNMLSQYDLPTLWSNDNDEFIDASNYCIPIMRNEWKQVFGAGLFDKAYTYDIIAAYPYFISYLPNTDDCLIEFSDKIVPSDWGIMKGKLELFEKISPVKPNTEYLTSDEYRWLIYNKAGKFNIENGYFFSFKDRSKPFKLIIDTLFALRNSDNPIASNIARKIAQGISGKLDQDNKDGSLGELYNPVLVTMVRSRCRLAVADFIKLHGLGNDLIEINIDSVRTSRKLPITESNKIGSWRIKEI